MKWTMWQKLRRDKGLTQDDVAKMLKVSKQYVSKIETGLTKMPDKIKIKYLEFRNNEQDKVIIDAIKEWSHIK